MSRSCGEEGGGGGSGGGESGGEGQGAVRWRRLARAEAEGVWGERVKAGERAKGAKRKERAATSELG